MRTLDHRCPLGCAITSLRMCLFSALATDHSLRLPILMLCFLRNRLQPSLYPCILILQLLRIDYYIGERLKSGCWISMSSVTISVIGYPRPLLGELRLSSWSSQLPGYIRKANFPPSLGASTARAGQYTPFLSWSFRAVLGGVFAVGLSSSFNPTFR